MKAFPRIVLCIGLVLVCRAGIAAGPSAEEFSWRARLSLPAGASMVRVDLPAEALMRLQSFDARDLRVFNAAGEAVPHTLAGAAAHSPVAVALTGSYAAFPLMKSNSSKSKRDGAVTVRIDGSGGPSSIWVRLDGKGASSGAQASVQDAVALPSAIFDLRTEKQSLSAITLRADLPANHPVLITAASSNDLSQWTPLNLRGRLYRFEGPGAPANERLEFDSAQNLQGRYLRLDWHGHDGVKLHSLKGEVAQAQSAPRRLRASLPEPTQAGPAALEWRLDFATPLAALVLSSQRANWLAPVRVLGRDDPSQAWRQLDQTVIFRLGAEGAESVNPPLVLQAVSTRWLRIEASHGMALDAKTTQASAEFQPLRLAFLASGEGPFTAVAGRAQTPSVALPHASFSAALPGDLNQLPAATIQSVDMAPASVGDSLLGQRLPWGMQRRDLALWAALLAGVGLLGAVAFSLLRQLKSARPGDASQHD